MISFTVTAHSPLAPDSLCENLFDPSQWTSFKGYGPIPGILQVQKDPPEGSGLGTVFHVENRDRSWHDEKVTAYIPAQKVTMHIHNFSSPLNKLATHFTEHWQFQPQQDFTVIIRTMELHGKNLLGIIILRFIALFLKKALQEHTRLLASGQ